MLSCSASLLSSRPAADAHGMWSDAKQSAVANQPVAHLWKNGPQPQKAMCDEARVGCQPGDPLRRCIAEAVG